MKNVLIINGHHPYSWSEGKLTRSLIERMEKFLLGKGIDVKHSWTSDHYDLEEEIQKHVWADAVVIQAPLNWFSVPWPMKKYMDDVFTAGLDGRICIDDGRTSTAPKANYGTGGALNGKRYMLSFTLNAPEEAFDNPDEFLMQGKSIDDLFLHLHTNYRFLAMEALPTFVCYDVMKNPNIERDFSRLHQHLEHTFQ